MLGALGCLNAVMAELPPVENSDHWRKRAEEARTVADRMLDAYTKVLMLALQTLTNGSPKVTT